MENLLVRIDVEAGGFLFVEGTERGEVRTRTFQRQITANDIHDVAGGTDLFEGVIGDQPSHAGMLAGVGIIAT